MTDDERAFLLKMAEYHQNAMQSRRAIQLKIFTATVVVFLLLADGTREFALALNEKYDACLLNDDCDAHLLSDKYEKLANLMKGISVAIVILFTFGLAQIEHVSKRDRNKYDSIEDALWRETNCGRREYKKSRMNRFCLWILKWKFCRRLWKWCKWSWRCFAFTAPVIAIFFLALGLWLWVDLLQPIWHVA